MLIFRNVDPTATPILKSIVLLSVPMMLEMVAQNFFNLVDTYFVSKIAYQAVGALVSSSIAMMVIFSVSIGISTAAGMYIASFWGAKKSSRAKFFYSNAFILMFSVVFILSLVFYVVLGKVIDLVGLRGLTGIYAYSYLSVATFGFTFSFVFSLNSATLRSIALPSIVLGIMVFVNFLNAGLDPLFIFYFRLGIKGAALATIVSIFIGVIIQFFYLFKEGFYVKISSFRFSITKKLVNKGFYASLHLFFRIVSMLILIKIIGDFSQVAVAAYSVVIRIYQVLLFLVFGLANTAFVMVGQNFGAGKIGRVKSSAVSIIVIGLIFIGALDLIMYVNKDLLISVFISSSSVAEIAKRVFFFYFLSYPFIVMSTISARSSMALYDTKRPSIGNLVNLWFFLIPLAYFLSFKYHLDGIWLAIAVSNFTAFVINVGILFSNVKRLENVYPSI